jgi:hypothetical protein
MTKTVAQKMGIKENSRSFFVNSDKEALDNINLPKLDIPTKLEGGFDYIHLFVKTQTDFMDCFPKLKPFLNPNGMLWVSWP